MPAVGFPMFVLPRYFARTRRERVIAVLRVILAATSLVAVWIDPSDFARDAATTNGLYLTYAVYAAVLLVAMWRHEGGGRMPWITQVIDVAAASVFQYLTLGPSSPFFVYFVFALFSAALRWGWRGTVRTAVPVLASFVVIGVLLSLNPTPDDFALNRFVVRMTYLVVVASALVFLGQHEERLRDEILELSRWPVPSADGTAVAVTTILAHGARIVGAGAAVLVWSTDDEPWVYLSSWPSEPVPPLRLPPTAFEPLVPSALADVAFFAAVDLGVEAEPIVHRVGARGTVRERPVHADLIDKLPGAGLASVPFRTDQLSGRVFFSGLVAVAADVMPLVEIVGREIGAALDQAASHERARQLATTEAHIRVARDLHDGVLQSLTGIRLELQSMARGLRHPVDLPGDERLRSLERVLALEQRELRRFIEELKPATAAAAHGELAARLGELRRRLALEWRTPIAVRVHPSDLALSPVVDRQVALMVQEAIVNALKHGRPSRVSVDVCLGEDDDLQVTVADDGCGFSFNGRRDHRGLVDANLGPVSLRERVVSLGGTMAIDSSPAGARVELRVPRGATHG